MNNKGVLIGTFVNKKQILQFLEMLKTKYHISYNKIFVYSIDGNYYEYLVTFKALEKEVYKANVTENLIRNYNGSKPSVVSKCLIGITITISNSYSIFDKETQTLRLYEDIQVIEVSPTSSLFQKVLPGDLIRTISK